MKYLVGVIIVFVGLFGYMYKHNQNQRLALEQEHQARIENEKAELQKQQQVKSKKELEEKVGKLKEKINISDTDAENVIKSELMKKSDTLFYVDLSSRWADAGKIAGSSPRMSLAQPVATLQSLSRELELHTTSTLCEAEMKSRLLKSYNSIIDGFLSFMRQNEAISSIEMERGAKYMEDSSVLLDYCTHRQ